MNVRKYKLKKSIVFLFLLFILPVKLFAAEEKRVIFDENFTWITQKGADRTLSRIKQAGFNVFVPVVWHGRGVSWNSVLVKEKEPRWENTLSPQTDPLAYLIEKAHSMGIEVHPWFTVALRQRDFFPSFYDEGTPKKSFNIHQPEFRGFIVKLMVEVVNKYNIDGVNLDYIRAMGVCDSLYCIKDYKKLSGRSLMDDIRYKKYNNNALKSIIKWNKLAVTDIVIKFSKKVRLIKPGIIISVDTHPLSPRLLQEGAASIDWLNQGYIDLIYKMDYYKDPDEKAFNKVLSLLERPERLVLLVGNFILPGHYGSPKKYSDKPYARTGREVLQLIKKSKKMHKYQSHLALYDYTFMNDDQLFSLEQSYTIN